MSSLMRADAVSNSIAAQNTPSFRGQACPVPAQLDGIFGTLDSQRDTVGPLTELATKRCLELEVDRLQARLCRQQEQLRQVRRQLAGARAAAYKALARHLHDDIGASLTGLNLDLTMILHELAQPVPDTGTLRTLAEDALHLVSQVGSANRSRMAELRPPHLEHDGLAAALRGFVQAFQPRVIFPITLAVDPELPRLDPLAEYQLYQIAQEAIINAARHAEPRSVAVTLQATPNGVRLLVADDGKGIDPARLAAQAADPHWGLSNIVERAELIGGRCEIISLPGLGTQIIAEVIAEEGR